MPDVTSVNVLVVDDDRAAQRLLADVLTAQGFCVTLEGDGEWALKTFEQKAFDLVVLDLLLPGMNGYEVARKLKETPKGRAVPLVMISGVYKNELHQKEALERYGAAAFVEKPFKPATLVEALRGVLGERYPAPFPAEVPAAEIEVTGLDDLADGEAIRETETVERATAAAPDLRGDFDHKPFPEVLAEIYRWRRSGALLLRRDKAKKIVYFRDGVPQFVKSNLLSECLGRVLIRERMITEADCEESLIRMKQSKRRQGTVLIDMGRISPSNLAYALNLQLRLKLFDIFTWRGGDYAFDGRASVPPETVGLDLTAAQCIYEGVRRAYDAERLAAAMGDAGALAVHPSEDPLWPLQEVALGEDEHALLLEIDGRKTVAQLEGMGILPPLDALRLLYAMKCAQGVALRPASAASPGGGGTADEVEAEIDFTPPPLPSRAPRPVAALPPDDEPLAAPSLYPTPPPLPRTPKKDTVPFRGVDTQPLSMVDLPLPGERRPVLPELARKDESAARERLAARVAAMRRMDFFEVLGLPRDASDAQVAQAYLALARDHHPDRLFGSASAEIRQLATQLYNLITAAHDALQDAKQRHKYLARLAIGEAPRSEVGEGVGRMVAAEGRFEKGEELLRQGEFAQACRLFEEAVKLYGEEGEFHALLAWSRFQLDPEDPLAHKEALESLERAIQLNPKSDRAYLFTGYIYKALGKPELAQQSFERAIQANPANVDALRELSILNWAARLGGGKG